MRANARKERKRKSAKERKRAQRAQKSAKERFCVRFADNQACHESANRALVIVFSSRQFLRLRNAFKRSVFEASKNESRLKPYY